MKATSFSLFFISLLCLLGCENSSNNIAKISYGNLNEDEMPIIGWNAPKEQTDESYRLMKDCGLNTIIDLTRYSADGDNSTIYKGLEYASNHDINYLVRDNDLLDTFDDSFKSKYESRNYKSYSSFAGFFGNDEPSIDGFPNVKKRLDNFRKYDNDHLFYVNLLGEYTKTNINSDKLADDYDDNEHPYHYYINKFCDVTDFPFVSIDHYPCIDEFPTMRAWYYERLEIASSIAKSRNKPFWNFILASEHFNERYDIFYRNPSIEEFYWQVNSSFLYGAKGIEYFCYQQPDGTDSGGWTYGGLGGSCIDSNGNVTPTYYLIQKVNRYISRIDHVLMNSTKITTICHNGGYSPCDFYGDTVDTYGEISNLDTADDILISVMNHKGKNAYFIFNPSLEYDSNIDLSFNKSISYNLYFTESDFKNQSSSNFEATIKPGEAVLLEVI